MKSLVKYKFYLMMLLATILFAVGAVERDQTELSIGDTKLTKKPTIRSSEVHRKRMYTTQKWTIAPKRRDYWSHSLKNFAPLR